MRYLINVIDSRNGRGSPDEMQAIDAFNDRLVAEGHWVTAAGIEPPDKSTFIDARGVDTVFEGRALGPDEEYVSGFWIIEAPGDDAALALAAEGSRACNRKVQLRRFLGS
jgi:hypothetical protein